MKKSIIGLLSFFGLAVLVGCGDQAAQTTTTTTDVDAAKTNSDAMKKDSGAMQKSEHDHEHSEHGEGSHEHSEEEAEKLSAATSVTVDASYVAPPGNEPMRVTIDTNAEGIITSVKIAECATHPVSQGYQQRFTAGISEVVVGKELAGLQVDVVGGASLTTGGFNAAIAKL